MPAKSAGQARAAVTGGRRAELRKVNLARARRRHAFALSRRPTTQAGDAAGLASLAGAHSRWPAPRPGPAIRATTSTQAPLALARSRCSRPARYAGARKAWERCAPQGVTPPATLPPRSRHHQPRPAPQSPCGRSPHRQRTANRRDRHSSRRPGPHDGHPDRSTTQPRSAGSLVKRSS
jgi:hypothetical protein